MSRATFRVSFTRRISRMTQNAKLKPMSAIQTGDKDPMSLLLLLVDPWEDEAEGTDHRSVEELDAIIDITLRMLPSTASRRREPRARVKEMATQAVLGMSVNVDRWMRAGVDADAFSGCRAPETLNIHACGERSMRKSL